MKVRNGDSIYQEPWRNDQSQVRWYTALAYSPLQILHFPTNPTSINAFSLCLSFFLVPSIL